MRLSDHLLRDLFDCEFNGISQIAGTCHIRWTLHQQFQSTYQIVDKAEAASLAPGAVDRDRSISQRLDDEVRNDAPVVFQHARTVRVENAGDFNLNPVSSVVVKEKG